MHGSDEALIASGSLRLENGGNSNDCASTTSVAARTKEAQVSSGIFFLGGVRKYWSHFKHGAWRERFSGWRGGTLVCIIICAAVLFMNLVIVIVALASGNQVDGMVTTFQGDCTTATRQLAVSHLFINFFSSLLLGASNYCMQRLVAPTRQEIDDAHARRKWLDIGIQSVRNLGHILPARRLLWLLLGASSLPLHFMYNSAVLGIISTNLVDFAELNYQPSLETHGQFWDKSAFANLTNNECHDIYNAQMISKYGAGYGILKARETSLGKGTNTTGFGKLGLREEYSYCVAEIVPPKCAVQMNLPIVSIVLVINAIKLYIMALILLRHNYATIVTIGDAIQSFCLDSDMTTKNRCLLSTSNLRSEWQSGKSLSIQRWKPRILLQWHTACSARRWLGTIIFTFLPTVGLAVFVMKTQLDRKFSLEKRWNSFGHVSSEHFIDIGNYGILGTVFFANTPHFIVSFLYFLYNGLFTCMLTAREWTQYSVKRAPLRVTCPSPGQRSTHFLQLPYTWSVPLLVAGTLLHWFISQAFFVARVAFFKDGAPWTNPVYRNNGSWTPENPSTGNGKFVGSGVDSDISTLELSRNIYTGIGYSDIALVSSLSLVIALILVCVTIANIWTYPPGLPIGSTNSAVISAACHYMYEEDSEPLEDMAQQPLKWGVTIPGGPDHVGHLCFTDGEVEEPEYGSLYAGVSG